MSVKSVARRTGGLLPVPTRERRQRVEIALGGANPSQRRRCAEELAELLAGDEHVLAIDVLPHPAVGPSVKIDRLRAKDVGIDVGAILDVVDAASDSGALLGSTAEGIPVIALVEGSDPGGFAGLSVRGKNGAIVPLRELVSITEAPRILRRRNGRPEQTVIAEFAGDRHSAIDVFDRILAENPPPAGCTAQILHRGPPRPSETEELTDRILLWLLTGTGAAAILTAWHHRRDRALRLSLERLARLRDKASFVS